MPPFEGVLLIASLSFGGPARAPAPDRWFARDKALHFAASAVIQSVGHRVLRVNGASYPEASRGAAVATLTVGVGKEAWDRAHGRVFSWRDLTADAAGTASGAVLMRQVAP